MLVPGDDAAAKERFDKAQQTQSQPPNARDQAARVPAPPEVESTPAARHQNRDPIKAKLAAAGQQRRQAQGDHQDTEVGDEWQTGPRKEPVDVLLEPGIGGQGCR